jgi:hypothetical protein
VRSRIEARLDPFLQMMEGVPASDRLGAWATMIGRAS